MYAQQSWPPPPLLGWYYKTKARWSRARAILQRIRPLERPQGAEIGVWNGGLSSILLAEKPDLTLAMVDSWEGEGAAYVNEAGAAGAALWSHADQAQNLKIALHVTEFAASRRRIVQMRSTLAAAEFADASLDFVFIDADHSYEGCMADIVAWAPKVKSGGWLCGHDYANTHHPEFGVKQAVDEFTAAHALPLEIDRNFTWFTKLPSFPAHPAARRDPGKSQS
jgi:hypothetical protein